MDWRQGTAAIKRVRDDIAKPTHGMQEKATTLIDPRPTERGNKSLAAAVRFRDITAGNEKALG